MLCTVQTAVALTVGLSSPIPPPLRCSSGFVSGYSDSDRSDVGSAMVIFNFHDTDPNVKGVYLSDMEMFVPGDFKIYDPLANYHQS